MEDADPTRSTVESVRRCLAAFLLGYLLGTQGEIPLWI